MVKLLKLLRNSKGTFIMKKLLVVLVGLLLLSGCSVDARRYKDKYFDLRTKRSMELYCDRTYGVLYISNGYFLTVIVSRDGTPVTCEMEGE